ncbi:Alpha/Beta hydrolase protein [Armillaria novae-zelandiae]|uniref:Alpha/Beta hydrolase protein n=1 Tax=Armillaria novae-zelandiae TaxID=153914 RepID=A0AA39P4E0_9AGAR|nr:Alpha/Beta hydrolase protein [Armillaria novae-zelandiae]
MTAGTIVSYPSSPALVPVLSQPDKQTEWSSLRELVEGRCRSLFDDFKPVWWLKSGHTQTVYCVMGDFSKFDQVEYSRTYLRLLDGGTLGLDFAPAENVSVAQDAPIIVVLTGLTGGSYEPYVKAILSPACTPVDQGGLGYRAVVVNFRGCAGVPITSSAFYNAGSTDDLRQALIYVRNRYPHAPLLGLAFSLGGNIMIRYLADEKEESRLSTAFVLGCPWNLSENSAALEASFLGRFYSKSLGGNFVNIVTENQAALGEDPSYKELVKATVALKFPTLTKFDDFYSRVAGAGGPPFPFPSGNAYYKWASSHYVLPDIRVPLLTLNARDDPVVRRIPASVDNPYVIMASTKGGGHLGWFLSKGDKWIRKPVLEWLRMSGREIVPNNRERTISLGEDGFLREEGERNIGCKEIRSEDLQHVCESKFSVWLMLWGLLQSVLFFHA